MFRSKKLYALALILAAGVFLAGCTPAQPAATATAAPTATEVPAIEVPVTEVPVTVVPATEVPVTDAPAAAEEAGEEALLLTLEELKAFDGKEGRRAYVAVDGFIYDMTDSNFWGDGVHNGQQAGNDLTQQINESPHGVGNLARVPMIGRVKVELSLEELKAFDGKEGRRAYVAVDGIIFDVTDSPLWASGTHNGNQAGQDLTQALAGAPHGPEKLENVVEIGVLVE